MKKLLIVLGLSLSCALLASAAEGWETDFEKASSRAKLEKKPMLLDFTGSDWCSWCVKLDKEVFSKKSFKDYAAANLVLVTVDFPNKKKLPPELKKQNDGLAKKYGIRGYPTIVLLNSEGEKIGTTGYKAGGPDSYVKNIQEIIGAGENKAP